jgi:PAS domain S-box-containing protein
MNDLGDMRMVDENCDVMNSAAQQLSLASLNLLEEAVTARDQAKTANQRLQQEIAEHKASEEALRVSEEQHRLLLQFLPVGVVVHASDTSILISNQEAERLLGLSMEMMQGKTALDPAWRFVREDGSPMPVEEYPVSRVLATGKPVENLLLGVDRYMGAERVWILVNAFPQLDEAGQVRHVEVTFMDLTERKRVEVALNNERLQLRTLIDNLPYSIYVKDTECRFVIANQTLVRRMGVDSADVLMGHDDEKFHPAELARQYRDDELRIMREGIGFYGKEERTRIADGGGLRWSSTTKVPIKNAAGDVIGLVGIGIDITERKRTESYREMRREIIQLLNEPGDLPDVMQRVITVLKMQTGFDAVGIRLQDGEDFPYYAQQGFPQDFILAESTLIKRGADGELCRDTDGHVCLECTCGLVVSGKSDPASPLFTKGGSFWTNNSFPLLDLVPDQDPRYHPRNQCMKHGYASMALIPVRDKDRIIGLIHLNDRRKDCFTVENVELLENIASYIGGALMRRKAEAALEKQNGLVNSLLQNLQIGVYMVEVPSGKPLLANEASFKMLGRGLLPE